MTGYTATLSGLALALDGLEVIVSMDWQVDGTHAERITVTVPEGYAAVPPSVTVAEQASGTVHIFEWQGM